MSPYTIDFPDHDPHCLATDPPSDHDITPGTPILVFCPKYAKWSPEATLEKMWADLQRGWGLALVSEDGLEGSHGDAVITHWMELPVVEPAEELVK